MFDSYPKISIVTPSFNQGKFLEETICSVISQGYPNLEYIIIDGGSTDGSLEIIKNYSGQFAFWASEKDSGQYHAIQKGFEKSTGEIMTYLNSDDVLTRGSLFTVAQIFSDCQKVKWLSGLPNHIDENGRFIDVKPLPRWNRYKYLNGDFKYIQQEGIFWRREVWTKAGGYISTKYKLASDLELWSRFFSYAELYFIRGLTGSFRLRSTNQRSLELLEEYNKEAETILSTMQASQEERRILAIYNNRIYRRLSHLPILWRLSFLREVNDKFFNCPPPLHFDRTTQRFCL
jgi:glycosyltransferase involved in cell wall biosynthesis